MRAEEKTVHTPLGLAIVVPSPLVRETIDLWRTKVDPVAVTAPAAAAAP